MLCRSAARALPQVRLVTSRGNIDVELWPKEAPLACRNFVQLCLEGVRPAGARASVSRAARDAKSRTEERHPAGMAPAPWPPAPRSA